MSEPIRLQIEPQSRSRVLSAISPTDFSPDFSAPGLSGLAHKIHRNYEDYGLGITIQKTFSYLARALYFRQVYRIYRIKLDATAPEESIPSHTFTFKILNTQNVDIIAQI